MQDKVCCFIGHRKIDLTKELEEKTKNVIEDLIINKEVKTFLFGSKSEFDSLCHKIVTDLKDKYPHIKRVVYTCKSEGCTLESEKQKWEQIYFNLYKEKIDLLGVDEEFKHKTKYTSGKASYVERNQAMIDISDYCIFYYNENYKPQPRKQSKRDITYYQPKSGTSLAYKYAQQKKKEIINIFIL